MKRWAPPPPEYLLSDDEKYPEKSLRRQWFIYLCLFGALIAYGTIYKPEKKPLELDRIQRMAKQIYMTDDPEGNPMIWHYTSHYESEVTKHLLS